MPTCSPIHPRQGDLWLVRRSLSVLFVVLLGAASAGCAQQAAGGGSPQDGGADGPCAGYDLDGGTGCTPPLDGYTLIIPVADTAVYLVDIGGVTVHSWNLGTHPGLMAYLLDNGELLATYDKPSPYFTEPGVNGGGIALFSWNGAKVWSYEMNDDRYHTNHDVAYMSNGHILAIAYERLSASEALGLGFSNSYVSAAGEVWSEAVFEIDPATNAIVWEWHAKDHLGSGDNRIDPTYTPNGATPDWLHLNDIDYNEALDQIVISSRSFSEFWMIDHNTTTAEAAGSAGDLLYRYGNPEAYGGSGAKTLFLQHDVEWTDPNSATSHILLFDNGDMATRPYSTADELSVSRPYTYGQADLVWEYGHGSSDASFFADHLGSAQRLANGDTLICVGTKGYVFEVNAAGNVVWDYQNTQYGGNTPQGFSTELFRAVRYPVDYPGLQIQ